MVRVLALDPGGQVKIGDAGELKKLLADPHAIVWADLCEPDEQEAALLEDPFGFHPLAIEDALEPHGLPKLDIHDNYLLILWRALEEAPHAERIRMHPLALFVGHRYVVTVHRKAIKEVDQVWDDFLEQEVEGSVSADAILHRLLDNITDAYFPHLDRISDDIDHITYRLVGEPTPENLQRLFLNRTHLQAIRKAAAPEREVINMFLREGERYIAEGNHLYFRDIYDHLVRITDLVDTARETIAASMELYTGGVSNQLNEVMKRLTIVATVLLPITAISGIYGMNFDSIWPPHDHPLGFYSVVLANVLLAAAMYWFFRRKGW